MSKLFLRLDMPSSWAVDILSCVEYRYADSIRSLRFRTCKRQDGRYFCNYLTSKQGVTRDISIIIALTGIAWYLNPLMIAYRLVGTTFVCWISVQGAKPRLWWADTTPIFLSQPIADICPDKTERYTTS
jgi:hypothetical protein